MSIPAAHTPVAAFPTPAARLLGALAAEAAAAPHARKLLVARARGEASEALRALAASGVPWIGFEPATPWQIAQSLVGEKLVERGLRVIDEFDQAALLDDAIDSVLQGAGGKLAEMAEGLGLRQAVANAVQALRLAGIDAPTLARASFRDEEKRKQLADILSEYGRLLEREQATDAAGVFKLAYAALAIGEVSLDDARVLILPGQNRRGLSGRLLDLLVERGATVLPDDPVFGLPRPPSYLVGPGEPSPEDAARGGCTRLSWLHDVPGAPGDAGPSPELFAATSVTAELREVLRRTLEHGLRWDEVEVIATDPIAYGVALDGLARRLGIPVSYAVGLPVARTRPGRAVASYLDWIAEGFPADVLRGMLERGDLAAPTERAKPKEERITGTTLARRLRRLKVGRGRARYEEALARAGRAIERPPSEADERTPGEIAEDRALERATLEALSSVLRPILSATPVLPDRTRAATPHVSPADLARGVLALLDLVPLSSEVDHTAWSRLHSRLERILATSTRQSTLEQAVSVLVSKLDTRVPAPDASGAAPWGSAGGHLHLSDIEHGGHTGRPATFVVGLDAVRFPGGGIQDALLVDDDRRRLTSDEPVPTLPTAADRIEEKRYGFAALLARLRGRVTLSYAGWDAVEGRSVPPSAELLQAFRLVSGDAAADYDALHRELAPAASAVPRAEARLDADDVWLGALADGVALRAGQPVVRDYYVGLGRGYAAGKAVYEPRLTPHDGAITPRPALDPRGNPDVTVAATKLERLGRCPLQYLLRHVLGVKKPDDPELSAEQWLSPLERGSLLHSVYERTLRGIERTRESLDDVAFEHAALAALDAEIAVARERLPPPGEAVFEVEAERLREDVRAFVAMVREDGPRWLELERAFGRRGAPPVPVTLPGGVVHAAGAIDRVDRLDDGRLVVIDYKTGSSLRYGGKHGAYDGGRRLQHVLYAAVAETLYGARVARAEYHFPSRRTENHRARYDREMLVEGLGVADRLLGLVAAGLFHPTTDPDDCRFCDFADVCRVKVTDWGDVSSPRAEWAQRAQVDELTTLRELRR